jgi:hypothetical protein
LRFKVAGDAKLAGRYERLVTYFRLRSLWGLGVSVMAFSVCRSGQTPERVSQNGEGLTEVRLV